MDPPSMSVPATDMPNPPMKWQKEGERHEQGQDAPSHHWSHHIYSVRFQPNLKYDNHRVRSLTEKNADGGIEKHTKSVVT